MGITTSNHLFSLFILHYYYIRYSKVGEFGQHTSASANATLLLLFLLLLLLAATPSVALCVQVWQVHTSTAADVRLMHRTCVRD